MTVGLHIFGNLHLEISICKHMRYWRNTSYNIPTFGLLCPGCNGPGIKGKPSLGEKWKPMNDGGKCPDISRCVLMFYHVPWFKWYMNMAVPQFVLSCPVINMKFNILLPGTSIAAFVGRMSSDFDVFHPNWDSTWPTLIRQWDSVWYPPDKENISGKVGRST